MNLFNMGPMEIIFILVLALLIFGPSKLPEAARNLGKAITEFRHASQELTSQVTREMERASEAMEEVKEEVISLEDTAKAAMEGEPVPVPETAAKPTVQPSAPAGESPVAAPEAVVPPDAEAAAPESPVAAPDEAAPPASAATEEHAAAEPEREPVADTDTPAKS